MFSWFKRAPPDPPFTDRVWLDADARRRGLLREVASAPTLLVAPFPEDEDTLAAWLDAAAVTYRRGTDGSGTWGQPAVTLVRADRLHHLRGPGPVGARPVVFGHFPHPIEDRALREVLAALLPAPPIYLSALDDPLLRQFGGDRTQELMVKLGMDPDEAIEHPLVSRALSRAREKVGERVPAPARPDRRRSGSPRTWVDGCPRARPAIGGCSRAGRCRGRAPAVPQSVTDSAPSTCPLPFPPRELGALRVLDHPSGGEA